MRYFMLFALVAVGCGAYEASYPSAKMSAGGRVDDAVAADAPAPAEPDADGQQAVPNVDSLDRKIIYTAHVDLVVEEFDPLPAKVEELTEKFKGYVASSYVSGSPGSPRSGQWSLRVPVENYEEFLAAAQQLGEVRSVRSDSKDVSEEFYDVEARIRNKKKEEERLLQLLADATGKLPEILSVEKELARVRGEIEQMEGRLRVLENLTSLTTVNLSVEEIKNYVPPEAPTYATRVSRAFSGSITGLVVALQNLSIALIAALPWLAVLALFVFVLVVLVRVLFFRRRRSNS